MVKTIVALLVLLLVLVGPASAQEPEPQSEESSADGSADEAPASPEDPEDPAEGAPEDPDGSDPAPEGVGSEEQNGRKACRVVATHIADPKVSPSRWVNPDPDGCFRRAIDRLIPPSAGKIIDRVL